MKSTNTYVEKNGYLYGCHLTPDGRLRCGACGKGQVDGDECAFCHAKREPIAPSEVEKT